MSVAIVPQTQPVRSGYSMTSGIQLIGLEPRRVTQQDSYLLAYPWPGNVRELRNVMEHAVIVSNTDTLSVVVPENEGNFDSSIKTLDEIESQHIIGVLRHTGGRIKGPFGAARILGMNPSTLYSRIQKLGITFQIEKGEISS